MDFFEHQEQARQSTRRLIVYFTLAVVLIILAVYLAFRLIFLGIAPEEGTDLLPWWKPLLFQWVAGGTLAAIAAGSAYKIAQLSEGGAVVADWLGGRPIDSNTPDPRQRRLLNVVEEMAIASGTPVPSVFLLENDHSINAFAAGFTIDDAVVGVTQGTVELLSRDELQGVIAHEFSHILNGDMRLNIRLMGTLHGILVIALIGHSLIRGTRYSRGKKGEGSPILLLGIALFTIGFIGVFFGRLIKSAVSRQREFLADASAVQFTRQPDGIAGALKKIGGTRFGSTLQSPKAEEASHFLFADGVAGRGEGLARLQLEAKPSPRHRHRRFHFLATHPRLEERIRRIDPSFDGTFPPVEVPAISEADNDLESAGAAPLAAAAPTGGRMSVQPADMTHLVGSLSPAALAYATSLLGDLDPRLKARMREPSSARAVILSLLLSPDSQTRKAQFQLLNAASDPLLSGATLDCSTLVDRCPPEARLPLIDLALPALRQLSRPQYLEFTGLVERLVRADNRVDLFEYTLGHILRRHLKPGFEKTPPSGVAHHSLAEVREDVATLLSSLAQAGQDRDPGPARKALLRGLEELGESSIPDTLRGGGPEPLEKLGPALERLNRLAPLLKRRLIRACGATVIHDGKITLQEGELLRATADALDCPIPPILTSITDE